MPHFFQNQPQNCCKWLVSQTTIYQTLRKVWTKGVTVWKFHDFSITQILREFNFGESRKTNSAILTHSETLNLNVYDFLLLLRTEIYQMSIIRNPVNCKNGNFRTFRFYKSWFHVKFWVDSKIFKYPHCGVCNCSKLSNDALYGVSKSDLVPCSVEVSSILPC